MDLAVGLLQGGRANHPTTVLAEVRVMPSYFIHRLCRADDDVPSCLLGAVPMLSLLFFLIRRSDAAKASLASCVCRC